MTPSPGSRLWAGLLFLGVALAPVPIAAQAVGVDIRSRPDLVTPGDRLLLQEAKFALPENGTVLTPEGVVLGETRLRVELVRLRKARLKTTLADLDKIQQRFIASGSLSAYNRDRIRQMLARDWEIIPPDIRDGYNKMVEQSGVAGLTGPDYDWARAVQESWVKNGPGALPSGLSPGPGNRPYGSSPRGPYQDEFSPPSASEVSRRVALVDAAVWRDPKTGAEQPYSPEVRALLREVVRYADAEDGEAVLAVLREMKPSIVIDNKKVPPYAAAVAGMPGVYSGPGMGPAIALRAYDVAFKQAGEDKFSTLPHPDASYYRDIGMDAPRLAAMNPSATPTSVKTTEEGTYEYFSDRSARFRPGTRELSGSLIHELMHLNTARQGGGAHAFTNEMCSFAAEGRWRNNALTAAGLPDDSKWTRKPLSFRRDMLEVYSSNKIAEVRSGDEAILGQIGKVEEALAGDLSEWRRRDIEHRIQSGIAADEHVIQEMEEQGFIDPLAAKRARAYVQRQSDAARAYMQKKNIDARDHLELQKKRLEKDYELSSRVFLRDWRWHLLRTGSYEDAR